MVTSSPTPLSGADPASCSHLGGALRRTAATIASCAAELSGSPTTPTVARLADVVVARLDAVGAAVQAHAQELAEIGAAAERLAGRAAGDGLLLDGWKVIEPFGLASAPVAERRLASRPGVQAHADRLASRLGRARAQLERTLRAAAADLADAVDLAERGDRDRG